MQIRKKTVLSNPEYKLIQTDVKGIEVYITSSNIIATFHGKKSISTYFTKYPTCQAAILAADEQIKNQFDRNNEKVKKAQQKKTNAKIMRDKVKVGDIFYTSWGYDQTNVDFFEVIDKPSSAKVTIRQISSQVVLESFNSNREKPIPGAFIGEAKNCLVNEYGYIVRADRYGHNAYPTTPETSHYTSWGKIMNLIEIEYLNGNIFAITNDIGWMSRIQGTVFFGDIGDLVNSCSNCEQVWFEEFGWMMDIPSYKIKVICEFSNISELKEKVVEYLI